MRRPTMTKQVEEYLTLRRAMGFDLVGEGYQLHAFARFVEETGHAGPLTTDLLLRWVQAAKKPGPVTASRRVEVLRPFLKYCRQFDPVCPVLPLGLCGPAHRRIPPHIYSGGLSVPPRTVHYTFDVLRQQLGWIARGGHPQPRIHDLRHTFTCRALLRGQQENRLDHVADAIATYVGHAKVSDTYWYVTAIPELMGIASDRFSRFSSEGCR